jgi:hypothetical protein
MKKILIILMVMLLASSVLLINASAYTEPASLLGVDIDLEVGRYSGGVFTPLTEGEALYANDVITVRIAPTTDFLTGVTRYVAMFTKSHLQAVGTGKAAFTPNYDNTFYATVCTDYAGITSIPESAWPPALKSVAAGGNGTFTTNSAVAVNNTSNIYSPNGGYPGYLTGEWLFRFDLRVTQDITPGSGVKIWMDNQWVRRPGYTNAQMYFTKCLDSERLSSDTANNNASSTIYFFDVDLSDANIDLEPSAEVNITFDANGGSGGWSGPMNLGDPLTAPTVTRPGYAFAGWSPSLPATVEAEATYTAQWVKTTVSVTQVDEDTLAVNIEGWSADYSYQIWSYQKITSDLVLNGENNVQANQWVVSMPYALGSTGTEQLDGSLTFNIDNFISPSENYTIAVRIADENGDYINEMRDAYTEETLLTAKITKVLVDGAYSRGSSREDIENNIKYTETKEITANAETLIQVIGNLPEMTYTATVLETSQMLTASNGNEFVWDISTQVPRQYTIRVTASNGATTDTRDIKFLLYESAATTQYGNINSMNITGGTLPTVPQNIQITPSFSNGYFYYTIQEAGRGAVITSGQITAAGTIEQEITQYGVYSVHGFANRSTIAPAPYTYDDAFAQKVSIKRSQVLPSTVDLSANVNLQNPVQKGTSIVFDADADIGGIGETPVEYSYWRQDADGYLLIKDWSSDSTLSWTPGRVGQYKIEVRAKGEDAGSYEAINSVIVNVESTEQIAQQVVITVNEAELNLNARAWTPITVKASATNTNGEDLLYKFNLAEPNVGARTVQNYSALQDYVWMPKKAGVYEISVLVKNEVSFGRFDAIQKITVTVTE